MPLTYCWFALQERDHFLMDNAGMHCTNSQLAAENAKLQSQLSMLQEKVRALKVNTKMRPAVNQILESFKELHIQGEGNL